jgi:intraflagellar transport protein 81
MAGAGVDVADTRMIVERLSGPPFNKTVSMAEIHDEWTEFQLVQLVSEVMAHIDSANGAPSIHAVDIRQEQPDDTVGRIMQFLAILKFGRKDL